MATIDQRYKATRPNRIGLSRFLVLENLRLSTLVFIADRSCFGHNKLRVKASNADDCEAGWDDKLVG